MDENFIRVARFDSPRMSEIRFITDVSIEKFEAFANGDPLVSTDDHAAEVTALYEAIKFQPSGDRFRSLTACISGCCGSALRGYGQGSGIVLVADYARIRERTWIFNGDVQGLASDFAKNAVDSGGVSLIPPGLEVPEIVERLNALRLANSPLSSEKVRLHGGSFEARLFPCLEPADIAHVYIPAQDGQAMAAAIKLESRLRLISSATEN